MSFVMVKKKWIKTVPVSNFRVLLGGNHSDGNIPQAVVGFHKMNQVHSEKMRHIHIKHRRAEIRVEKCIASKNTSFLYSCCQPFINFTVNFLYAQKGI